MPEMFKSSIGRYSAAYDNSPATSAAANTKGAWVEFIASTPFDADGLFIYLAVSGANAHLIDIGIGAAGAEVVLVANLAFNQMAGNIPSDVLLPIHIPAGKRIAIRNQSNAATQSAYPRISLLSSSLLGSPSESRCTTYGANVATSNPQSLDSGSTANTFVVNEVSASLTYPVRQIVLTFSNLMNSTRTTGHWYIKILRGASGSEVVVFEDIMVGTFSTGDIIVPGCYGPIPVDIPAGERLSIKIASDVTDATDRLLGCNTHCFG